MNTRNLHDLKPTRRLSPWLAALALTALACRPKEPAPPDDGPPPPPPVIDEAVSIEWPDEPFRAQQPEPGPAPQLTLPQIKRFTLPSGVEVYLVEQQRLPTVYMTFEFDLGGDNDPAAKVGLHRACLDLMDESTRRLDKVAFEEAQADLAVQLWASAGTATSTIGLRALKGQLGPGLDLFSEMIREPGLRQQDLDRLLDRYKTALAQWRGNPSAVAGRVYNSLVYGPGHPKGAIPVEANYAAIKLADCKAVISKLKPGGARLFVVGMVTEEELRRELGARLGAWSGKAPAPKKLPPAKPRAGTIFLVDMPGAQQSVISIGHLGPQRGAADYEPTYLMAQILGGSFSSRINMNIREDKGYAYGARGGFGYDRDGSTFEASSSVRTDVTGPALREILKEMHGMRAGDPTAEELRREQEGAIAALPASFSTPTRTLSAFRGLVYYGLPLDWYSGHLARIRAVDPAAVRKAAGDHVQGSDYVVLVVGDAAVIRPDLEKMAEEKLFGAGGLVQIDADGKPVSAAPAAAKKP
ncbi:MAG: insulinase family protein [Nannocystis sp.]|nr:insulinase family protein [Nannocystis sp.]